MLTVCPRCHSPLTPQQGAKDLGQAAEDYADCQRICEACGIGLSNSPHRPTFIRRTWQDGLWRRETAARLERIVAKSLNGFSRTKKLSRLANERSEDLLTWNVFSWLEDRGLLGQVHRLAGLGDTSGETKIFYWGSNDRYDLGLDLASLLQRIFHEAPDRLSEPDVILVSEVGLAIIEAKFGSPNDRQPGREMEKYLTPVANCFSDRNQVETAGLYELTRYWAIGNLIAKQLAKRFALVNLVCEGQEREIERTVGRLFSGPSDFKRLTWEQLTWLVEPAMALHMRRETLYFEDAFPGLR